ncbi:hypothetical protein DL771_001652 [Monosporascus sp. 5C6A]|nr:hypothetical protein DL771_001652 [Monosporascus sp. 5C6A]
MSNTSGDKARDKAAGDKAAGDKPQEQPDYAIRQQFDPVPDQAKGPFDPPNYDTPTGDGSGDYTVVTEGNKNKKTKKDGKK